MISTYKHRDITWIDLENPTQDEVRSLAEKYGLDPLVANDLLTPSSRPMVDEHSDYTYLIFHFPVTVDLDSYGKSTEIQELDFILGKDFIITNRYTVVDTIMEFSKTFTVNSVLDKSNMGESAGYLFFYMIRGLYEELSNRLEHVHDLLRDAEERIFSGEEKEMVRELSKLNRVLLHFNKAVAIHEEILKDFNEVSQKMYGEEYRRYFRTMYADYLKVKTSIDSEKGYLDELRETNDSLLTTKQNEIMKNLTVMTFIMLPLSLIASVFGMNTMNAPRFDFMLVLVGMVVVTLGISVFFKFSKWF